MTFKPWHLVVFLAFSSLPALNSIDACLEHDTWWHLAIGKDIVNTGRVPECDPLSRMSKEEPTPWRAYSWLYEVVVYQIFETGSFTGILFFRTALIAFSTVTVLAFLMHRGGVTPSALFAGALSMAVLMMLAKERPWHFTIAFTTLTLWITQELRDGLPLRRAWWLLPMFALWANLHIQFVLGWGILGLACLFPKNASRAGLLLLAMGCFAATAVNPYHVHLLEVIWEYATQAAPLKYVQELSPPDYFEVSTIATLLLLAGGTLLVVTRRPIDAFELGLLVVAAVLAARMRRDVWFAAIVAIAMFRSTPPLSRKSIAMVTAGIVTLIFGMRFVEIERYGHDFDYAAAQQSRFPVNAVTAIRQSQLPGPIFNEFDWGGYIAWNLPSHPVSIDGRTNLYGCDRMNQSFATWSTEKGWENDPDILAANIIMAPKDRVLTISLKAGSEWRILFEDDLCVVFVRRQLID